MALDKRIAGSAVAFRFDVAAYDTFILVDQLAEEYGIPMIAALQTRLAYRWDSTKKEWAASDVASLRFDQPDGPNHISAASLKALYDTGRWEFASHSCFHKWNRVEPEGFDGAEVDHYIPDETARTAYLLMDDSDKNYVSETPFDTYADLLADAVQSKLDIDTVCEADVCKGYVLPYNDGSVDLWIALQESGYEWASSMGSSAGRANLRTGTFDAMMIPRMQYTGCAILGRNNAVYKIPTNTGAQCEEMDGAGAFVGFTGELGAKKVVDAQVRPYTGWMGTLTMHGVYPDSVDITGYAYASHVSHLRQLIEYLLENNIEIVTGSELARRIRHPHLYPLNKKGVNLLSNGHLRYAKYGVPAVPEGFGKDNQSAVWVPPSAAAPLSEVDGLRCGHLEMEYADYGGGAWPNGEGTYYQATLPRRGRYRLRMQIKKGTSAQTFTIRLMHLNYSGSILSTVLCNMSDSSDMSSPYTTKTIPAADMPTDWTPLEIYFDWQGDSGVAIRMDLGGIDGAEYKNHLVSDLQLYKE